MASEPTLSDVMARLDQNDAAMRDVIERLDKIDGSIQSVRRELQGIYTRLGALEQAVVKIVAAAPMPV